MLVIVFAETKYFAEGSLSWKQTIKDDVSILVWIASIYYLGTGVPYQLDKNKNTSLKYYESITKHYSSKGSFMEHPVSLMLSYNMYTVISKILTRQNSLTTLLKPC